eukprot:MONOS_11318.1-p1 / transcript=MONOS_11318.1 / gene=MONOS_11318 / organism=Monocercomonoides_exilis_PA203 / gene_product=unspecified product / transcript_product=unspecified product / location=Mono_scaffold00562:24708-27875(-) / protein_length=1056 / sequence_SO=supercontig / SO=protein_coding / is_pseudo=false
MGEMPSLNKIPFLNCIRQICEDIESSTTSVYGNVIASGIHDCLQLGKNSVEVIIEGIKTLNSASSCLSLQMKDPAIVTQLLLPIINMCGPTIDSSFGEPITVPYDVRKECWNCIASFSVKYYICIYPFMSNIFNVTIKTIDEWIHWIDAKSKYPAVDRGSGSLRTLSEAHSDANERSNYISDVNTQNEEINEIARSALNYWAAICTTETELLSEGETKSRLMNAVQTAAQGISESEAGYLKACEKIAPEILPKLIIILKEKPICRIEKIWNSSLTTDGSEKSGDDWEEKVDGIFDYDDENLIANDVIHLLTAFSEKLGSDLLKSALPLIQSGFGSSEHCLKGAALDLFACVLEGSPEESVALIIPNVVSSLQSFLLPPSAVPQSVLNPYAMTSHMTPSPPHVIPNPNPFPTPQYPHAPLSLRLTAAHTLSILCNQTYQSIYEKDTLQAISLCIASILQDIPEIAFLGTVAAYNLSSHVSLASENSDTTNSAKSKSTESSASEQLLSVTSQKMKNKAKMHSEEDESEEDEEDEDEDDNDDDDESSLPNSLLSPVFQFLYNHLISTSLRNDGEHVRLSASSISAACTLCQHSPSDQETFLLQQMPNIIQVISRKYPSEAIASAQLGLSSSLQPCADASGDADTQSLLLLMGGCFTSDKVATNGMFLRSKAMLQSLEYKHLLITLVNILITILEDKCNSFIVPYLKAINDLSCATQLVENKNKEWTLISETGSQPNDIPPPITASLKEHLTPCAAHQLVTSDEWDLLKTSLVLSLQHSFFRRPEGAQTYFLHFANSLIVPALAKSHDEELFSAACQAVGFSAYVFSSLSTSEPSSFALFSSLLSAFLSATSCSFVDSPPGSRSAVWNAVYKLEEEGGMFGKGLAVHMINVLPYNASAKTAQPEGTGDSRVGLMKWDVEDVLQLRCVILDFLLNSLPRFSQMTAPMPQLPQDVKLPNIPQAPPSTSMFQAYLLASFAFVNNFLLDEDNDEETLRSLLNFLIEVLPFIPTTQQSPTMSPCSLFFTLTKADDVKRFLSLCKHRESSVRKLARKLKSRLKAL